MDSEVRQIRYNQGKPKLTYFWSNTLALHRALDLYVPDWSDFDSPAEMYDTAFKLLTDFLADGPGGSYVPLVDAFTQILVVAHGPLPELDYRGSFIALVCSADTALAAYCAVCDYGATKYARGNYRLGAPITQYLDSALRHLTAATNGDLLDAESQCPHTALALWNVWQALDQPAYRDDRLAAVRPDPEVFPSPEDLMFEPEPTYPTPLDWADHDATTCVICTGEAPADAE